jgi:hypothetical protein
LLKVHIVAQFCFHRENTLYKSWPYRQINS